MLAPPRDYSWPYVSIGLYCMLTRTHTQLPVFLACTGVAYMMSILLSSQTVDPKTLAPEVSPEGLECWVLLSRCMQNLNECC